MTGKELKAWANFIHDDAEIQYDPGGYTRWDDLKPEKLRAVYKCPKPTESDEPKE